MKFLGIVFGSIFIQLGIHHIPAMQAFFQITKLSLADRLLSLLASILPFILTEAFKVLQLSTTFTGGNLGMPRGEFHG